MITATEPSQYRLEIQRTLSAPPARVYESWTSAVAMKIWFQPSPTVTTQEVEIDPRVGGRFRIVMRAADGEEFIGGGVYEELAPPHRLVFTWEWADSTMQPTPSRVIIVLKAVAVGTEITLVHELLSSEESRERHTHGWSGCLDALGAYFAAS